jgi:transcription elongation factor GreB
MGLKKTNYITPNGLSKLTTEYNLLTKTERPEIIKVIQWAVGNGDRSENADYIYGKKKLREIDRRLRFLNKRISIALVIDPETQCHTKVQFGATVTILTEEEIRKVYSIVGIDEINTKKNYISWRSPLAKSLISSEIGDSCSIKTQVMEYEIEVIKIEYIKIN